MYFYSTNVTVLFGNVLELFSHIAHTLDSLPLAIVFSIQTFRGLNETGPAPFGTPICRKPSCCWPPQKATLSERPASPDVSPLNTTRVVSTFPRP